MNEPTVIIYTVHAVRPAEVGPIVLATQSRKAAEDHAAELSNDPGVLAAQVTQFVLNQPGTRSAVALFVAGQRQQVPYVSNDRSVNGR
ncbi:MAG: hypothetical protein JO100_16950 [Pseudonocardia sp.]|nr:hypothetical protein [Pseudonocardia sp.]